jgi:hypothetical protein
MVLSEIGRRTAAGERPDVVADDVGRAAVLAAGGTAYTEAGTFTHDQSVTAFTFRCQVPARPDDGQDEAALGAMAAREAHGHPHEILQLAVTDMHNIKIGPKGRRM